MWYNSLLARGLIPDWVLRRGVRSQGKERLNMMKKGNAEKLYSDFLNEASYGSIAVNTDDANNQHYEVDAEFFQYCLGKNLKYSCSFWEEDTSNLDEAEDNMLEIYSERSEIEDGMNVLDVGCGWGSLSLYLAKKYPKSEITGVSNSSSQKAFIDSLALERKISASMVKTMMNVQIQLSLIPMKEELTMLWKFLEILQIHWINLMIYNKLIEMMTMMD